MDRERIVGASPNWMRLKEIFRDMGIPVSRRSEAKEHISHGILVIVKGEGLFLQMGHTYEYRCILNGEYTGAKLYHYLSLITRKERELLLLHPFVQWRSVHPHSNMPSLIYHKMVNLQMYLPRIYDLIPMDKSYQDDECNYLLTIPKGRAFNNETSKDAALRELKEETGISLNEDDLSPPLVERYTGTDGNLYTTYIYAVYLDKHPRVTLGHEFKGYLWLSHLDNVLMKRQIEILQTFITDINDRRDKQICRCDYSRWMEQIWQTGYNTPCKATEKQTCCIETVTEWKSTSDQEHIQCTDSKRNDSNTVQSITDQSSLPPESTTSD